MRATEPLRSFEAMLTTEHPRPARIRDWPQAWWLAVGTVCFGAFMGQLDASIVTLTYPSLEHGFTASLAAVQWVSLAYLLALVALLVPIGRLSDAYGRKLVYLYGFLVFTAGSAACGFAGSLDTLVAFRIVQAAGAAMLQANSVALVRTAAPPARLRAALGVQAAAQAVGLALGPTLGGILVSSVGWRWVFWVNVPVGIIALALGWELLPRTRQTTASDGLDLRGVLLVAATTTSLLLLLTAVSGLSLPTGATVALAAVTVGSAGLAVHHQLRAPHPLIDRVLLGDRVIWTGLLGALGGYLVLFGPLVLVPVVLTAAHPPDGQRLGTLAAGLVLTALPVGFAAAATLGPRLLPARWSDRRRGWLGVAVAGLALAALLVVPLDPAWLVPLLGVLGVGLGVYTPSNNAQIMGAVPAASSGTAGGMVNMARSLGTALGVCGVTLSLHQGGARTGIGFLLVIAGLTLLSVLAAGRQTT